MLRLKVVGRREEPIQVAVSGGPVGMPQQYEWRTRALLLVVPVDEEGNVLNQNANEQTAIPAESFESLNEYVTGDVYAIVSV